MKFRKILVLLLLLAAVTLIFSACQSPQTSSEPAAKSATEVPAPETAPTATAMPQDAPAEPSQPNANMEQGQGQHHGQGMGHDGQGMGMGGPPSGMRERHQAPIPADYQGKSNSIAADEASLLRGETIYVQQCATCHGDGGMGDGPAGQGLDPAPAPVAHASQMLSDSYLFWRINEGGIPFQTAMIPYKNILSEDEIWDVINYLRALGAGQMQPQHNVGGEAIDPEAEAQMHADMLATGVDQGIITQEEADLFGQIHDQLDTYKENHMDELRSFMGTPEEMQKAILEGMVQSGEITRTQADAFTSIHNRLEEAGIMH